MNIRRFLGSTSSCQSLNNDGIQEIGSLQSGEVIRQNLAGIGHHQIEIDVLVLRTLTKRKI